MGLKVYLHLFIPCYLLLETWLNESKKNECHMFQQYMNFENEINKENITWNILRRMFTRNTSILINN